MRVFPFRSVFPLGAVCLPALTRCSSRLARAHVRHHIPLGLPDQQTTVNRITVVPIFLDRVSVLLAVCMRNVIRAWLLSPSVAGSGIESRCSLAKSWLNSDYQRAVAAGPYCTAAGSLYSRCMSIGLHALQGRCILKVFSCEFKSISSIFNRFLELKYLSPVIWVKV